MLVPLMAPVLISINELSRDGATIEHTKEVSAFTGLRRQVAHPTLLHQ